MMRRFFYFFSGAGILMASLVWLPVNAGVWEDYFIAVGNNDAYRVQKLLQRGFDPNTIEAERGDTGLILALREKSMDVVKVLLEAPGLDMEAKSRNGDNALMIAAWTANHEAVDLLLDKGAAVNRAGWTPLHYAAVSGNESIVLRLLDKKADPDARSPNGTTPLMMAARSGHIALVKLLLDAGADISLKNEHDLTAVDFAKQGGYPEIADGLLRRLRRAMKQKHGASRIF